MKNTAVGRPEGPRRHLGSCRVREGNLMFPPSVSLHQSIGASQGFNPCYVIIIRARTKRTAGLFPFS
jgi:hypothetical protein